MKVHWKRTADINWEKKNVSEFEDRSNGIFQPEEHKKKRMKKNKQRSLRDLWDIIKCINILLMGVPEGEAKEKEAKAYL